jgi:hypothetical protein
MERKPEICRPHRADHSRHRTLWVAAATAAGVLLSSCAAAPAIQPADTSKSRFEGSTYGGDTITLARPTPGEERYRVFEEARTGMVPLQSVRSGAEERARAYCTGKGKAMHGLVETAARPPYIQDNFARVELIFECIAKPAGAGATTSGR